jgi:phosphohistidine phosphatase
VTASLAPRPDVGGRTLVILRHAKAEHPVRMADVDRPLTDRGHDDAAAAGRWLEGRGYRPSLVLCSPARRARQTWLGLSVPCDAVQYDGRLYGASAFELLDVVAEVDDGVGVLLLVGHNPGLGDLSAMLDPVRGDAGLRTCGIAVHAVDTAWAQWTPGGAPLTDSHTARA